MSSAIALPGDSAEQAPNVADVDEAFPEVERAAADVQEAEAVLAAARARLRAEIVKAVQSGAKKKSYSAVGRAAGVSRQYVAQLMEEARKSEEAGGHLPGT